MKKVLVVLLSFSAAAQAHESLVPHEHPHGLSMLPGTDAIACAMFVLVAVLFTYWKFVRTP